MGHGKVEADEQLGDPRNIAIAFEEGLAFFEGDGTGLFRGHVYVLPTSRGSTALKFGRAALHKLFTTSEAHTVRSAIPSLVATGARLL